MDQQPTSPEMKRFGDTIVVAPVTELLKNPRQATEIWPAEAVANPAFIEQITAHTEQAKAVRQALDCLAGEISIEQAIEAGILREDQASEMYAALSVILDNPDYSRLALYLPFEILPSADWVANNEDLQQQVERFLNSYMDAWYGLLGIQDVRANFIDGDVLEAELRDGDLSRVVKAAHLIPKLIARGLLTEPDVARIYFEVDNSVLQRSIAEGLAAYHDVSGAFTEVDSSPLLSNEITDRRRWWLNEKQRDQTVEAAAQQVAAVVITDQLPDNVVAAATLQQEDEPLAQRALAEGVYGAVEQAAFQSFDQARVLYQAKRAILLELWQQGNDEVQLQVSRVLNRLYRIGVLEKSELDSFGIAVPNLAGPFSENLALFSDEIVTIQGLVASVERHPELSQCMYPLVAVGGSRLKGYGEKTSDIDVSVFIRPGTPLAQRKRIHELLNSVFVGYEPIEFWLDEDEDGLRVHDFSDQDIHYGDSFWTHSIFGTAWVGDKNAIADVQQKLLPPYFYESAKTEYGRSERALYLEKIEQDTLQYRLMHKGYKRHYPVHANEHEAIDGASVFWDSGYRRVATKLFVSNVFLPKLN